MSIEIHYFVQPPAPGRYEFPVTSSTFGCAGPYASPSVSATAAVAEVSFGATRPCGVVGASRSRIIDAASMRGLAEAARMGVYNPEHAFIAGKRAAATALRLGATRLAAKSA